MAPNTPAGGRRCEHRGGSTSPSASTRPREFVFVFAVRSSCACVCLFDCLFLCVPLCFFGWLVGCLWVYGFSSLFGPLGHLLVCFFCNLGESFMCVLHLWRPWGSIVAPGAPFWNPWATCCRFSTLFVALGLNFDTPGLHLGTLWRPFWCLFKTLGRDPGPSGDF